MNKSTASLRVSGDDLDPEDITQLLGSEPSFSYRNGDLISPGRSAARRKCGMWLLKSGDAEPEDYHKQIESILSSLTNDLEIWRELSNKYEVDFFFGFFMGTGNDGFTLPSKVLNILSERHIDIGFDIYAPSPEDKIDSHKTE